MKTIERSCVAIMAGRYDFADVTDDVARTVAEAGLSDGHVTLAVDGDCALVVNERESGLIEDMKRVLERGDGLEIGSDSVVLPAVDGQLRLGTWQRVLLVELGSGGQRTVTVLVEGE